MITCKLNTINNNKHKSSLFNKLNFTNKISESVKKDNKSTKLSCSKSNNNKKRNLKKNELKTVDTKQIIDKIVPLNSPNNSIDYCEEKKEINEVSIDKDLIYSKKIIKNKFKFNNPKANEIIQSFRNKLSNRGAKSQFSNPSPFLSTTSNTKLNHILSDKEKDRIKVKHEDNKSISENLIENLMKDKKYISKSKSKDRYSFHYPNLNSEYLNSVISEESLFNISKKSKANSFNKLKESLDSLNYRKDEFSKQNKLSLNLSVSNESLNTNSNKKNSRYIEFIDFYRTINNILTSK